jgi:hypothetical protein
MNEGVKDEWNITIDNKGYDTNPSYSPNGRWIAWQSMERDGYESDENRLFVMDLETGEKRFLSRSLDSNVDEFAWIDDHSLVFNACWHATVQLYRVDMNGNMLILDDKDNPQPVGSADVSWKRCIGNGAPKHNLSWTNSFSFYNFDLSVLFTGAFDFSIFNMRKYGMGLKGSGTDNVLRKAYTDYADVNSSGGIISSYFLEKGDYFKLDNVTLGYTLTPKSRQLVESFRVYLTAKNVFTLTGYEGNDPSIVTSTGITPGIDSNSAYPQATQVSLGVTVRFH